MTLSDLLASLGDVEQTADGYLVHCPAHEDSQQSLRLTVSDAGKVLLKCRAGCPTTKVVAALGLTMRDLAKMTPGEIDLAHRATSQDVPADPADVARLAVQLDRYAAALSTDDDADEVWEAFGYAADRFGIDTDTAHRLGLGLATDLPGGPRLVVPFRDADGVARGFQARALSADAEVRWYGPKSPEGASWTKVAYFEGEGTYDDVLVCEGPGDSLTGAALGYDTIGIRGAALASNPVVVAQVVALAGDRTVVIAGDGDAAGRAFSLVLAEALAALGAPVRILDLPDGQDLTDWRAANPTRFRTAAPRAIARAAVFEPEPEPEEPDYDDRPDEDPEFVPAGPTEDENLSPMKVVNTIRRRFDFARTPTGSVVTIPKDPNAPKLATEVSSLESLIDELAVEEFGAVLTPTKMSSAKRVLSNIAGKADVRPAPLRIHEEHGSLLLDLGTKDGTVVSVTADGWEVLPTADAARKLPDRPAFLRTAATQELPAPITGGPRELLRDLLGFTPEDTRWKLVYGWLVGSLFESTSRPILWVTGPQGSGKSTRARMVKSIIDPSDALGRAPGGNERDDTTSAAGRFVPSWDNLSTVDGPTSDWFCTIVTGAVTDRRKLYTDEGLHITSLRRTGVATSIATPLGLRADALERLVAVEFDRVPQTSRRTEASLWAAFRSSHAAILGALMDDAAGVIRHLAAAEAAGLPLPRMADFAQHMVALDLHLGDDPASRTSYFGVYTAAVHEAIASKAEDEPLVAALVKLAKSQAKRGFTWEGSATDLRDAIEEDRPADDREWWPSGPPQLSAEVVKQSEACLALGLAVSRKRLPKTRGRLIVLHWQGDPLDVEEPEPLDPTKPPKPGRAGEGVLALSPSVTTETAAGGRGLTGPDLGSIL